MNVEKKENGSFIVCSESCIDQISKPVMSGKTHPLKN